MYLENVIRPTEVVEFAAQLQAHQVARLPSLKGLVVLDESDDEGEGGGMAVDGGEKKSERIGPETVLDRAVMEHNLLSCSKVRFFPFLTLIGCASSCRSRRLAGLVQRDVLADIPPTCLTFLTNSSTSTYRLPASGRCSTSHLQEQSFSREG